jgi:hypothetical protein
MDSTSVLVAKKYPCPHSFAHEKNLGRPPEFTLITDVKFRNLSKLQNFFETLHKNGAKIGIENGYLKNTCTNDLMSPNDECNLNSVKNSRV